MNASIWIADPYTVLSARWCLVKIKLNPLRLREHCRLLDLEAWSCSFNFSGRQALAVAGRQPICCSEASTIRWQKHGVPEVCVGTPHTSSSSTSVHCRGPHQSSLHPFQSSRQRAQCTRRVHPSWLLTQASVSLFLAASDQFNLLHKGRLCLAALAVPCDPVNNICPSSCTSSAMAFVGCVYYCNHSISTSY